MESLEPFEKELLYWLAETKAYQVKPSLVGRWILGYMTAHGRASPAELFRNYSRFINRVRMIDRRYKPPRYHSFYNLVWVLIREGLLVRAGSEPASRPWLHERVLLELAPGAESSPVWENPWAYIKGRR